MKFHVCYTPESSKQAFYEEIAFKKIKMKLLKTIKTKKNKTKKGEKFFKIKKKFFPPYCFYFYSFLPLDNGK